ncbi:MAG TPA: Ig-like domain-containing protein [Gemmatimonadaceae bacterium]|nr:Ig-like domain-containing protein [Gemmatimonadaceae bacterium]
MSSRTWLMCSLALVSACGGEGATGTASPVASISITVASSAVGLGANLTLVAIVRGADSGILTDQQPTWHSSNDAIATVDATGHVRGVALGGPVTITAAVAGKSAAASVRVTPEVVLITPNIANVSAGQPVQFVATAYDAAGTVIDGGPATWSISAPTPSPPATITAGGLFVATAPAPVTVQAVIAGKMGSILVGVPSIRDGLWIGASSTGRPVQIQVLYGYVTAFRLTSIPLQLCTTLQLLVEGNTLIVNDQFSMSITGTGAAPGSHGPGTVTGAFLTDATLSATISTIVIFGPITCDNGQVQPGNFGLNLGTVSLSR